MITGGEHRPQEEGNLQEKDRILKGSITDRRDQSEVVIGARERSQVVGIKEPQCLQPNYRLRRAITGGEKQLAELKGSDHRWKGAITGGEE